MSLDFPPDLQVTADFDITGQAGFFADNRRLAGFKRCRRALFLFTTRGQQLGNLIGLYAEFSRFSFLFFSFFSGFCNGAATGAVSGISACFFLPNMTFFLFLSGRIVIAQMTAAIPVK
ncbi:hypothetical protein UA45_06765 [Morganella morganii]|uniref:Uncharacterized protein n=1 Tax=Morganella morganii TaxID=582 RepID=A0A0D8L9C0_MORMO|nr:hypothetical protein UA45_06765 [Morganella morganii]